MKLIINENLKNLIPPLMEEEFLQLEDNIIEDGCREALTVWNGTIVDGHNRYDICTRLNIPFNIKEKHFEDDTAVRIWMRNNQMGRRNLTPAWRIELELGNKDDFLKKAGRPKKEAETIMSQSDTIIEPHSTRKEIAKKAGVSTGQVGMAEVIKKESPEMWEEAKQGTIGISTAYHKIKNEQKKQERAEEIQKQKEDIENGNIVLPVGVFEVITIDPPWNYGREYDPETSRVANPYPEMPQSELLEIKLPSANDSCLFLWTTHQFIFDAKELLDHWGFTYKTNIICN